MSNTEVTASVATTTVTVQENTVLIQLNNVGIQGVPGAGVASGGTAGQILSKVDSTNFNTTWIDNYAEETLYLVRNNTGSTILKGTVLAASGAEPSGRIDVAPFQVTGLQDSELRVMGVATANISNGVNGTVMSFGTLKNIDTRGNVASAIAVGDETWAEGDILFAHPTVAGKLTKVRPQHDLAIAFITVRHASAGQMAVRIVPGNFHLEWLHDVSITDPTNNQVLAYDSATQLWKNATNAPDGVTSITATAPLTGGTITSTGSIGLDQTALSLTRSQISDFASGTVTSASTAQQSGTALFATNAGTAVYATTSGTAVFATNASTAVNLSGSITKSQVSDFTSGTVASAGTAQQSGTAVFANTSGTATFATTSGTAVFATNASTAVTISGSIAQGQVTNLVTDLAGKANLAGGNALTGAQTVTSTATNEVPIIIQGASGQAVDLLRLRNSSAVTQFRVDQGGMAIANALGVAGSPSGISFAFFTTPQANAIPVVIRGAASQTASMLQLQNSAGSITANFTAPVNNVNRLNLGGTDLSATLGITVHASGGVGQVIRGAASQTADLLQTQNDSGQVGFAVERGGALSIVPSAAVNGYSLFVRSPTASVVTAMVRGAASQTADLLQLQNSAGSNLYRFDASGYSTVTGGYVLSNSGGSFERAFGGAFLGIQKATSLPTNPGANIGRLYFRDGTTAGTLKLCVRAGAAGAETTILDNIPQ